MIAWLVVSLEAMINGFFEQLQEEQAIKKNLLEKLFFGSNSCMWSS